MKTHFLQQPYEYDDYPWFSKVTNAEWDTLNADPRRPAPSPQTTTTFLHYRQPGDRSNLSLSLARPFLCKANTFFVSLSQIRPNIDFAHILAY